MRFVRSRVESQDLAAVRTLSARDGWLVETPEVLRAGLGDVATTIELPGGLESPRDAREQLAAHELSGDDGPSGSGVVAFASLPFERGDASHLEVPRYTFTRLRDGSTWVSALDGDDGWRDLLAHVEAASQGPLFPRSLTYQPTAEEYAHTVARAVELLRRKELDKVVLARAVLGTVPEAIDPAALADRLRRREPLCTVYSLPVSGARRYVGASPELLARREGSTVTCHPLAGTIALPAHVAPDDYQTWLLGSTKNLHEHAVLVDDLVQLLARHFEDIEADATPSIVALRSVAHLGTWIRASARDGAPNALSVLALLHPTAAVGGIPRQAAHDLIGELEETPRGHYAGPLGWVDERGDGEWWVGIRGVLVRGATFEAWAGAGIVSESDPTAEREETRDKLSSVLGALLAERI
ncbi:MAG TPA: isochorismate synthase [Acidimicrobiales bacterium]|nr:isochorismate synthase [Acidimicrobiales bacterium]